SHTVKSARRATVVSYPARKFGGGLPPSVTVRRTRSPTLNLPTLIGSSARSRGCKRHAMLLERDGHGVTNARPALVLHKADDRAVLQNNHEHAYRLNAVRNFDAERLVVEADLGR